MSPNMLSSIVRFTTHGLVYGRCYGFALLGWLATRFRGLWSRSSSPEKTKYWPRSVERRASSRSVMFVEGALVVGREGCVCDSSGAFIAEVAPRAGFLRGWSHPLLQRLRPWTLQAPVDRALLLSSGHPDNYYHWMFEVLPRMMLLERAQVSLEGMQVLAPQETPFQRESLARLGIANTALRRVERDWAVQVAHLCCTVPPLSGGLKLAETCQWLKAKLGSPGGARRRRILLQRRHGKRSIANFDELVAALAPEGFEVVAAERLSFVEQVQTFADAECIVAPHGAGLANLAFCEPGTRVVEILSADYRTPLYGDISRGCGLDYSSIEATPVGRWWELRQGSKAMVVSPDRILELLRC